MAGLGLKFDRPVLVRPGWEEILPALHRFLDDLDAHAHEPERWFTPELARALQMWLGAAEGALQRESGPDLRARYRELLGRLYPALARLQARLTTVAERLEHERRHADAVRTWCEHLPTGEQRRVR